MPVELQTLILAASAKRASPVYADRSNFNSPTVVPQLYDRIQNFGWIGLLKSQPEQQASTATVAGTLVRESVGGISLFWNRSIKNWS